MVMVAKPAVAVLDAVKVSVLLVVALAGLNDAVTPAGRPLAARLTAPLKLLMPAIVIVLLPLVPATTLRLLGEDDRE
jgi:hypothetical protein